MELKTRCWQGWFPRGLQARLALSGACILWLVVSSCISKALVSASGPRGLPSGTPASISKGPCDHIRPTQTLRGDPPTCTPESPLQRLLPDKVTCTDSGDYHVDTFGGHYPASHRYEGRRNDGEEGRFEGEEKSGVEGDLELVLSLLGLSFPLCKTGVMPHRRLRCEGSAAPHGPGAQPSYRHSPHSLPALSDHLLPFRVSP